MPDVLDFLVSKKTLKEFLDNLLIGAYIVDKDRRILYWNRAAEEISGFTADEVVGSSCFDDILDHRDQDGNKLCTGNENCPLVLSMNRKEVVQKNVFLKTKQGTRIPVRVVSIPAIKNRQVIGAIEIFEIEKEPSTLEVLINTLSEKALTDSLTVILNKESIIEEVRKAIQLKKKLNVSSSLIFFDIDDFKKINDHYGHQTGDEVLKKIADTVKFNLRTSDSFGRYGGEEFLVVALKSDADHAFKLAERIRNLISMIRVADLGVTVSIGVTEISADDTVESLIDRADKAMYKAKSLGKNRTYLLRNLRRQRDGRFQEDRHE